MLESSNDGVDGSLDEDDGDVVAGDDVTDDDDDDEVMGGGVASDDVIRGVVDLRRERRVELRIRPGVSRFSEFRGRFVGTSFQGPFKWPSSHPKGGRGRSNLIGQL